MGAKYEVFYWDYRCGKELTYDCTNSIIKAYLLVRKLEKQFHCVGIRFRRDRVRKEDEGK